ncbi:MAG TPA: hypothetical protein VH325_05705 [Bryobacteraceae bacterium]|nr:hypothetical protein [Bryobacteraceae bacterium]
MPTVGINRKASDRVESGHPWIFASDVLNRGELQPEDLSRRRHLRVVPTLLCAAFRKG